MLQWLRHHSGVVPTGPRNSPRYTDGQNAGACSDAKAERDGLNNSAVLLWNGCPGMSPFPLAEFSIGIASPHCRAIGVTPMYRPDPLLYHCWARRIRFLTIHGHSLCNTYRKSPRILFSSRNHIS
jgi:hypothetical protein